MSTQKPETLKVHPSKLFIIVEDEDRQREIYESSKERFPILDGYLLWTFKSYPQLLLQPAWNEGWETGEFPTVPLSMQELLEGIVGGAFPINSLDLTLERMARWVGPKILDLNVPKPERISRVEEALLNMGTYDFSRQMAQNQLWQRIPASRTVIITGSDPVDLKSHESLSHELTLFKTMRVDQLFRAAVGLNYVETFD